MSCKVILVATTAVLVLSSAALAADPTALEGDKPNQAAPNVTHPTDASGRVAPSASHNGDPTVGTEAGTGSAGPQSIDGPDARNKN
jgi:hypothetical protein